jgi:hypothetical protein
MPPGNKDNVPPLANNISTRIDHLEDIADEEGHVPTTSSAKYDIYGRLVVTTRYENGSISTVDLDDNEDDN